MFPLSGCAAFSNCMRWGLNVNSCRLHVHQCRLIVAVISTASAGATISFRIESVEQVLNTITSGFSIRILEFNPRALSHATLSPQHFLLDLQKPFSHQKQQNFRTIRTPHIFRRIAFCAWQNHQCSNRKANFLPTPGVLPQVLRELHYLSPRFPFRSSLSSWML